MTSDDKALVILIPSILIGICFVVLMCCRNDNKNEELKQKSFQVCVQAGKQPLECKAAIAK